MAQLKTKRTPRYRRVPDPPRMVLTERDYWIVYRVYEHRFLSRDQIAKLFFPAREGSRSATLLSSCNARLQRLFQHGYLHRQMLGEGSGQAIYSLDRKGASLVAGLLGRDVAGLRWSPKQRRAERYFMEHTLAINDVWVTFELAARADPELKVVDWAMDGRELWDRVPDARATRGYLPVRPDSFFELAFRGTRAYFFLEVDRSTMPNRRFAEKVRAYHRYWKSGRFGERHRAPSFRVLVTAPTLRRRENLRRTAAKEGARGMFLFAVHGQLRRGCPSDPIWLRAHSDVPVSILA